MLQYIGTKIISAKPMKRAEFVAYRYPNQPHNPDAGSPEDDGYLVEYHDGGAPNHPDHKGYISWSPKAVFDAAYVAIAHPVSHFPPHVQRLAGEHAELMDRIIKLTWFFSTPIYEGLEPAEQIRLRDQALAMGVYARVLGERLTAAGVGVTVNEAPTTEMNRT